MFDYFLINANIFKLKTCVQKIENMVKQCTDFCSLVMLFGLFALLLCPLDFSCYALWIICSLVMTFGFLVLCPLYYLLSCYDLWIICSCVMPFEFLLSCYAL